MTDLQSTLDAIDAVTADACTSCQTTLTEAAPSRDFCCQDHQARWQAAQVNVAPDPELLGAGALPPMDAVRHHIATTLSRHSPRTQVLVGGRVFLGRVELPVRNVGLGLRANLVIIDELHTFTAAVHETVAQVARVFGVWAEHLVPAATAAVEQLAPLLPETPPTDPRARALWLRQHRNTGPAQKPQRAPRELGTAARRRTR
jgi:hypothetical protein